jgi:hypothetical protein
MAKLMSPLQQLRQLDKQREKILEHAKEEALVNAEQAITALNDLGFNYRLTEVPRRAAKKATKKRARTVKDAPCPTCGFKTSPTHDGRAHRSQKSKKPFTPDELKERGLTKV